MCAPAPPTRLWRRCEQCGGHACVAPRLVPASSEPRLRAAAPQPPETPLRVCAPQHTPAMAAWRGEDLKLVQAQRAWLLADAQTLCHMLGLVTETRSNSVQTHRPQVMCAHIRCRCRGRRTHGADWGGASRRSRHTRMLQILMQQILRPPTRLALHRYLACLHPRARTSCAPRHSPCRYLTRAPRSPHVSTPIRTHRDPSPPEARGSASLGDIAIALSLWQHS